MQVIYINLDRQADRRAHLQKDIASFFPQTWKIERFPAIDKNSLDISKLGGRGAPGAIALSMGHREAVRRSVGIDDHLILLEDDTRLSPRTAQGIELAIKELERQPWDIIFTDACIPSIQNMVQLFVAKKSCDMRLNVVDLHNMQFAGTSSLVFNKNSKEKYLELLNDSVIFTQPIDLLIKQFVWQNRLKAFLTVPYLTSLSKDADASEIQAKGTEMNNLLWNSFRRLMFIDSDPNAFDEGLACFPKNIIQEDAHRLGLLIAMQASWSVHRMK
jgi:GR25 family glycosyltransferase involved in LPS biosynthesis